MDKSGKSIFVFDLDGTLGEKSPFYPKISKQNIDFIRELSDLGHLVCLATDRPKSLALAGMKFAGLNELEVEKIFSIRIYEDGLFIETKQDFFYNALDHVSSEYKAIKESSFSSDAIGFFADHGFSLYSKSVINTVNGEFLHEDYDGNKLGVVESKNGSSLVFQQDNVVRETYKFPDYFFQDLESLENKASALKNTLSNYLDGKFDSWRDFALLRLWRDCVDIYPKMDSLGVGRKGFALSMALSGFDISAFDKAYICCDGINDLPLAEWAKQEFSEYLVVCPSNVKKDLLDSLKKNSLKFTVLEEDCREICDGLRKILGDSNQMTTEQRIDGVIVEGHRIASGLNDLPSDEVVNATIRKQRPYFEKVVPGFSDIYNGSVNVDISPRTFDILKPDHEITCEWAEGFRETFWFVSVSLVHNGTSHKGWIYYPCPGPLKKHSNNKFEFLAPWIDDLNYGDIASILYSSEKVFIKD